MDRRQRGGDYSTNIQSEVVHVGPSYSEVKEIATDVFKANFLELGEQAALTAQARAEEFIDAFLEKLSITNPDGAAKIQDPDMQYTVFTASRDYARSNKSEHKDMLASLLVEKTRSGDLDLQSIAVSEAVEAVRKISIEGADTLTSIFCFTRVRGLSISTFDECVGWYREVVFPWLKPMSENDSVHDSLAHAGCTRPDKSQSYNVRNVIGQKYPHIFHDSFQRDQFDQPLVDRLVKAGYAENLNSERARLLVHNAEKLREAAEEVGDGSRTNELFSMLQAGFAAEDEFRQRLVDADHQFGYLLEAFSSPPLESTFLTNVGVAVAHANWARVYPSIAPPLSIWF